MVFLGVSERGYEVAVRAGDNGWPFNHPAVYRPCFAVRGAVGLAFVMPAHEAEGRLVAEVAGLLDVGSAL